MRSIFAGKLDNRATSFESHVIFFFSEIGRPMFEHELPNETQLLSTIRSMFQEENM